MQAVRRAAHRNAGRGAAEAICNSLAVARQQGLAIDRGWTVSGYWPIRDEMDIRKLLASLHEEGMVCALPVVRSRTEPLSFRRWRPGDVLEQSGFGLSNPPAGAPEAMPRIVLTPLLAVDTHGNRLGYGGGYYDRTLRRLRAIQPVVAVGVAFEAQLVAEVPHDARDEPLDWLVTEKGPYRFGA